METPDRSRLGVLHGHLNPYSPPPQAQIRPQAVSTVQHADAVVIGAGVVGLAIAQRLALAGHKVLVLEAEHDVGQHSSSRNSEVIHGGIYYVPGSLKAKLCIKGRDQLYAYCKQHGVKHDRTGKLVVAHTEEQVPKLRQFLETGRENGMTDLKWLEGEEAMAMEPELHCVAALLSPSTGIIDSHGLMQAYRRQLEQRGGSVACSSQVVGGNLTGQQKTLVVKDTRSGAERQVLAHIVVNAAGLFAQKVSKQLQGVPGATIPQCYYARGHYCTLKDKAPFRHLIYPMPESWGLGVHLTLDLHGSAKFGPDVEWLDTVEYNVDEQLAEKFYSVIRLYWPGLPDGALTPSYSGIRSKAAQLLEGQTMLATADLSKFWKVVGPGQAGGDFVIQGEHQHGLPGFVTLYGIESPGLTSSLAIADLVHDMLTGKVAEAQQHAPSGDQLD